MLKSLVPMCEDIAQFCKGYENITDSNPLSFNLNNVLIFQLSRYLAPHNLQNQAYADTVLNVLGKSDRAISLETLTAPGSQITLKDVTDALMLWQGNVDEHLVWPLYAVKIGAQPNAPTMYCFALYDTLNQELKGLQIEARQTKKGYVFERAESNNKLVLPVLLKLQEKLGVNLESQIALAQKSAPKPGLELIAPVVFNDFFKPGLFKITPGYRFFKGPFNSTISPFYQVNSKEEIGECMGKYLEAMHGPLIK